MKILFSLSHWGLLRTFESVVRGLAERGHELHIVSDRDERLGWQVAAENLMREFPSITCERAPRVKKSPWYHLTSDLRRLLDYLRYLGPLYDAAPKLRSRAAETLPAVQRRWLPIIDRLPRWAVRGLAFVLRQMERTIPSYAPLLDFLAREKPDLVLLTPLLPLGSSQIEFLRASKVLGLRTALCVGSWDHLSSKALLRDFPDRVLLWNQTQKNEAIDFHHVPADRIVITGAQCYDQWFEYRSRLSYEDFSRGVGLRTDRPFILYVGSALFQGSPLETDFVRSWVEAIRGSEHAELRDVGLLLRPHPSRMDEWEKLDVSGHENVVIRTSNPVDDETRASYFESLYHSAAVMGLNTSAFLEAGIVGRPVHTILAPEFWDNQEGTLHFHYLLNVEGGLLRAGRSFDEHLRQLAESLVAGNKSEKHNRAFVEAFVRPLGLDVSATKAFVDACEALGESPQAAAEKMPRWRAPLRMLLHPLARLVRSHHRRK